MQVGRYNGCKTVVVVVVFQVSVFHCLNLLYLRQIFSNLSSVY